MVGSQTTCVGGEENTVCYTSTWKAPTEKECKEEIIDCARALAKKKWFEDKKTLRNRMNYYANILNIIEEEKAEEKAEEFKKYAKKKMKLK